MTRSDFEPTNGFMLKTRMLNGGTKYKAKRSNRRERIMKPKLKTKISSFEGGSNNDSYINMVKNYPINMDKKIFGMRPKTLAISLGVIIVSIIILNMSGKSGVTQVVEGGGL